MKSETVLAMIFLLSVAVAAFSTFNIVSSSIKVTGYTPTGNVTGAGFVQSGGLWIIGLIIALVIAVITLKNYRTKLQ